MAVSMRIVQVSPGWSWCAMRRAGNNPARGCTFSVSREHLFSRDLGRDWFWNNSGNEAVREREYRHLIATCSQKREWTPRHPSLVVRSCRCLSGRERGPGVLPGRFEALHRCCSGSRRVEQAGKDRPQVPPKVRLVLPGESRTQVQPK
jgi:hypothetical protein